MEELIRVVKPWETEFRITKDSHPSLLDEKHNKVLNFHLKKCDTWRVTRHVIFSVSFNSEDFSYSTHYV